MVTRSPALAHLSTAAPSDRRQRDESLPLVATFAALDYLLLVLHPASLYLGARLMGLGPLGAGFAAVLIMSASGGGDFGRYGLSYGAFVWRGSGLAAPFRR